MECWVATVMSSDGVVDVENPSDIGVLVELLERVIEGGRSGGSSVPCEINRVSCDGNCFATTVMQ